MADVRNRDDLERKLARILGRALTERRRAILAKLGDPPDLNNITAADWKELGQALQAALAPELQAIYLQQAQELLGTVPTGVDWSLVNRQAVDWARQYGFDLVSKMQEGDQELLRSAVSSYFEQGQTIGDLEAALQPAFSPVRAEMIAVTEVTRAAAEGEMALARDIAEQGITMTAIWQTNNDEIVRRCPICWPRHGKAQGDGWTEPPPGHPRCRCWVTHELPKVKR